MQRRVLLTGLLTLSLVTSGCSALRVSTGEGDSRPANVGIDDGPRQSRPTESDTATIPSGMSEVTVDLGASCPIDVQLAMDSDWHDEAAYDGYQLYTRGNGAIITVNCYEGDDSAQSIIDSAMKHTFSEADSTKVAEKIGSLTAGSYWTFHGKLAPDEMRAIGDNGTSIYGAVAGVADNGRLFKASVEMITKSGDEETVDLYEQMLPTVRIGGQELESPALS